MKASVLLLVFLTALFVALFGSFQASSPSSDVDYERRFVRPAPDSQRSTMFADSFCGWTADQIRARVCPPSVASAKLPYNLSRNGGHKKRGFWDKRSTAYYGDSPKFKNSFREVSDSREFFSELLEDARENIQQNLQDEGTPLGRAVLTELNRIKSAYGYRLTGSCDYFVLYDRYNGIYALGIDPRSPGRHISLAFNSTKL